MIRSSISSYLIPYPTRSIFCTSCNFDEAWNNFMDWYNSSIWSKLSLDSELERWFEIRWKQSLCWCSHMLMRDQHSREYNFLFNKYKISWNCLMLYMPSLHPSRELKPNWVVRSCNSWNNKCLVSKIFITTFHHSGTISWLRVKILSTTFLFPCCINAWYISMLSDFFKFQTYFVTVGNLSLNSVRNWVNFKNASSV